MIPSSIVAAGILLLAVLPGAAYTWALERQVGSFGVTLADRSLRFFGSSVVFHAVLAWPEYGVYRMFIEGPPDGPTRAFAALWGATITLLVIPFVIGSLLGGLYRTRSTRDQWSWVRRWIASEREQALLRFALGHDPAPRAWDHLFSTRKSTYVRVLTTDGDWIGGGFADASYAGGFPNDADLLLEETYSLDPETADLLQPLGYPVYIPASQIARIEIIAPQAAEFIGGGA